MQHRAVQWGQKRIVLGATSLRDRSRSKYLTPFQPSCDIISHTFIGTPTDQMAGLMRYRMEQLELFRVKNVIWVEKG